MCPCRGMFFPANIIKVLVIAQVRGRCFSQTSAITCDEPSVLTESNPCARTGLWKRLFSISHLQRLRDGRTDANETPLPTQAASICAPVRLIERGNRLEGETASFTRTHLERSEISEDQTHSGYTNRDRAVAAWHVAYP